MPESSADTSPPPPPPPPAPARWRGRVSVLLIVLAAILAPMAVAASWARTVIRDEQTYLEAVAPLATDPVITEALTERVADAVMTKVAELELDRQLNDWLAEQGLPRWLIGIANTMIVGLDDQLREGVERVTREVIAAPGFATTWIVLNERAHRQLVQVLDGESVLLDDSGGLALQLDILVDAVKRAMVDRGFEWAAALPRATAQWQFVSPETVATVQGAYRMLNRLATLLLIIVPALLVAAVAVAADRWRAVRRAGIAVALGVVLLGGALAIFLTRLGGSGSLPHPEAARTVVSTLTSGLHSSIWTITAAAAAAAVAGWIGGRFVPHRRGNPAE